MPGSKGNRPYHTEKSPFHPLPDRVIEHLMEGELRPKHLERSEERVYETLMSGLLADLIDRVSCVEDEKRRDVLKKTVQAVESGMFRYIMTRIELAAVRATKNSEASSYGRMDEGTRQSFMDADASRRRAHIALVDSINVAVRNIFKDSEEPLPEEFHGLVGDSADESVRERVAVAAIDYVYKVLDEEGWNQRFETSKPKEEGTI